MLLGRFEPKCALISRAGQKTYQCHGIGGTDQFGALADEFFRGLFFSLLQEPCKFPTSTKTLPLFISFLSQCGLYKRC